MFNLYISLSYLEINFERRGKDALFYTDMSRTSLFKN